MSRNEVRYDMSRMKIEQRVYEHGEILMMDKGYVSPIDLFQRMDWLSEEKIKLWRFKKISYLESEIRANLSKINFALKTLKKFATENQLKPSTTEYKSWGKGTKLTLQFSKNNHPFTEKIYRTHFDKRKKGYVWK